jgi:hypothetical protein
MQPIMRHVLTILLLQVLFPILLTVNLPMPCHPSHQPHKIPSGLISAARGR